MLFCSHLCLCQGCSSYSCTTCCYLDKNVVPLYCNIIDEKLVVLNVVRCLMFISFSGFDQIEEFVECDTNLALPQAT